MCFPFCVPEHKICNLKLETQVVGGIIQQNSNQPLGYIKGLEFLD
jgi:hypothetical protein